MSLSALARSDSSTILTADGDRVTLTAPAPASTVYAAVPCLFHRVGVKQDAEGIMVVGATANLTTSIADLAARGITDPEALKAAGWTATIDGKTYALDRAEVLIDYTLGDVTIIGLKVAA